MRISWGVTLLRWGAVREIAVGGWVRNPNIYRITISQSLTIGLVAAAGGFWKDSADDHFIADVVQEGTNGQKKVRFAEWNVPLVKLGIEPSRCSQVLIGKRL